MSKVAFELRADHEDFSGGSVSLPGGELFDVGDALRSGGGKITLAPDPGERKDEAAAEKERDRARRDSQVAEALANFPALKRASASDGGSGDTSKGKE